MFLDHAILDTYRIVPMELRCDLNYCPDFHRSRQRGKSKTKNDV